MYNKIREGDNLFAVCENIIMKEGDYMMNTTELMKWAVKGLSAEINELEKDVNRGKRYLSIYEMGGQPKTPKTPDEIREIIREKKAEIERLDKMKFNLKWELDVERGEQ